MYRVILLVVSLQRLYLKLKGETIIQEFEEFAGASIESIDPSQLAGKIDEFIKSRGFLKRAYGAALKGISNLDLPVTVAMVAPVIIISTMLIAESGVAVAAMGAPAAVAIAVPIAITAVVFGGLYASWRYIVYPKQIKNRRRPN